MFTFKKNPEYTGRNGIYQRYHRYNVIVFSSRVCHAFPWPRRNRYGNQMDVIWWMELLLLPPSSLPPRLLISCFHPIWASEETLYDSRVQLTKSDSLISLQDNTQNASWYTGKRPVVDCLSIFYINNYLGHQRFSCLFTWKKKIVNIVSQDYGKGVVC